MLKIKTVWSFEVSLGDQERLRRLLKPVLAAWVNEAFLELLAQLRTDQNSNCSTMWDVVPARIKGRAGPVWLALSFSVNRDIPADCAVMVASTEDLAMKFRALMQEASEELQKPFLERRAAGLLPDLKQITQLEFNTLAPKNKPPFPWLFEREWFAATDESLLGVVLFDSEDHTWSWVVLSRDQAGVFRAIELGHSVVDQGLACRELKEKMAYFISTGRPETL